MAVSAISIKQQIQVTISVILNPVPGAPAALVFYLTADLGHEEHDFNQVCLE